MYSYVLVKESKQRSGRPIRSSETENDLTWIQATLPVRCGSLGIRSAVQLAPFAFLASAAACSVVVHQIAPVHLQDSPIQRQSNALTKWSHGHHLSPPDGIAQQTQRGLDTLKVSVTVNTLFEAASNEKSRARLLAASSKVHGCMHSQYRLLA